MSYPEEFHVAEFTETGWSLEHPVICRSRGSLLDCPVHGAVSEEVNFIGGPPVEQLGRYVVTLGPNGPDYAEREPLP